MTNTTSTRFQKIAALAARAGLDWFVLALVAMIVLAYLWPEPGIEERFFSLKELANWGVSLIFFFYGLRLSPQQLKAGLGNWRLHLVIQTSTFFLFPLLVLPFRSFIDGESAELLWLGTFYLAALPSTVSSSVVMVSIAGGNITGAIFNASISSLLGIFITPLWMGLVLTTGGADFNLWEIIGKLILQVLLPVMLGVLLHKRWGSFALQHKQRLRYFDQVIILIIVYTSFSESFAKNMFAGYSAVDLLLLGGLMLLLFAIAYGLIILAGKMMGFNREDQITAVFCGSKKSLVHGTVMSKVLFADANMVGIMLLPIMIYHALQLLAASVIAQTLARKAGIVVKSE